MEHLSAITALLYLPIVLVIFLMGIDLAAKKKYKFANIFLSNLSSTPRKGIFTLLLVLMTAVIHLALIRDHWGEVITVILFFIDGIALLVGSLLLVLKVRHSQGFLAFILLGGILAYFVYLGLGMETIDVVGVGTKVIELLAFFMIMIQSSNGFVAYTSPKTQK